MPLARAASGSLSLGCLRRKNPAYPYHGFNLKFIFLGDAFGPGCFGLALLGYCYAMN